MSILRPLCVLFSLFQLSHSFSLPVHKTLQRPTTFLFAHDNDDDDGWGEEDPTVLSDRNSRELLESLQSERSVAPKETVEPERDLFIPIFVGVSIVGFAGTYTYETLRLYSRGELYLPF